MKIYKRILLVMLCFVFLIPSGCKSEKSKKGELVIGVEDINRAYDPFYIVSEADLKISSQIFQTVQRKDTSNNFINYCGGISYEYVGENQVLYTVTLKEDMFFSNGKNVTVDDLIFFYHYIADASYDGYYSDWHLNDIDGLSAYYYDDEYYLSELEKINADIAAKYTQAVIGDEDFIAYLVATEIEGRFDGNLESTSPDGSTWADYLEKYGFAETLADLGDNPSKEALTAVAAKAETANNKSAYDPESWYREKLYNDYITENYEDGINVPSISGIRKINDYSCTILFNSRNINALSEINVPLVSRDDYIVDYVKGNTAEIKEKKIKPCGSGPYTYSKLEDGTVTLLLNQEYYEDEPDFTVLKFVDLAKKDKSAVECLKDGEVDIITVPASDENISGIDSKDYHAVYYDNSYYISVFFNPDKLDLAARQGLAGLCNPGEFIRKEFGKNYTRLTSPVSISFAEYPSEVTEPYYNESSFEAYMRLSETVVVSLTAYYCGSENDFEYGILNEYKNILADNGVNLNIVITDEAGYNEAIATDKADVWIERVYDGATCDKFDYYNSQGEMNKTGLSVLELDMLTANLRSAVGFSNKSVLVSQISELVMAQAVEMPVCQLQTVTIYSLDKISDDSFGINFIFDDFVYAIPELKKK